MVLFRLFFFSHNDKRKEIDMKKFINWTKEYLFAILTTMFFMGFMWSGATGKATLCVMCGLTVLLTGMKALNELK